MKTSLGRAIKGNSFHIFSLIFLIDLLVSFFTADILHKNLDRKAQEVLTVEKDVKSNLEETEILLTMASNSVLHMLMQGGNQKTIW
ncbi:MAG: hypothetical protein LBG05_05830 [Treponema sp.]|jgi:hypothetical protein|nr:hypothetical protein [Treponema sp.]